MKKMFFFFTFLLLISCEKRNTIINHVDDLNEAKLITSEFYNSMNSKDSSSILNILGGNIERKFFHTYLLNNFSNYGNLIKIDFKEFSSARFSLNEEVVYTEYLIKVNVKYENKEVDNILQFRKGNSNVKLEYFTE